MPFLSFTEFLIIVSRFLLKFIGFILIFFLNFPFSWLYVYLAAFIATEALEFGALYFSQRLKRLKNSLYLILAFLNSFLVLYFIYATNLIFTDFYIVGFLIVLASVIQGGPLPGFISGLTTATFYSVFLYQVDASPIYYLRSLTFFVLGVLFTLLLRMTSVAAKEKEKVTEKYKGEIERLKDEFVAVASHNLLSPITSLKGYLNILASGRKLSLKESKFYLERALASSERLVEIVNELITVALLEKREKGLILAYTNIEELMNLVIEDFKLLASEKEINLTLTLPEKKLAKILIDPRRIRQAAANLLSNAIKFTENGGKVQVTVEKVGKMLRISVSDTGIGIPKEKIKNMFQKFFHAHSYIESLTAEGTGLGLYITKLIVNAHGGDIEVKSEEGKGSTFTITLPMKG